MTNAGNRARRTGAHCKGVGGPRLAGGADESGSGITAPFNAPSQGAPPWNVYRIEPRSATVTLGTEPGGLTRFRFDPVRAGRLSREKRSRFVPGPTRAVVQGSSVQMSLW